MKKIHFLFGIVGSVLATMVFAQSYYATCNGSFGNPRLQGIEMSMGPDFVNSGDTFVFTNGSACVLLLASPMNGPIPNENGTVFYQGPTAYCKSVVSDVVQQCMR